MQASLATSTTARLGGLRLQAWLLAMGLVCIAFAGAGKPERLLAGETKPSGDRSSLLLELLFEGDLADTSAARRTCTPRNGITFTQGKHGQCAALDGRNWIDTGFLQKGLGKEFTIECWARRHVVR